MTQRLDVIVLGAGPSGLSIAADCAERGLRTLCVAPKPDARWEAVYGVWPASLAGLDLGEPFEHYWHDAQAILDGKRSHRLGAPYAKLHNDRIQARLRARFERAGGQFELGRAVGIEHTASGSSVSLVAQTVRSARIVIDASGAGSTLLERMPMRARSTLQDTYGILGKVRRHPFDPAQMVLMDYRDEWLRRSTERADAPTFLYAMPFSDERVFVEETSLVQTQPISTAIMKARLEARLRSLDIEFEEVELVERGRIAMASPMPKLGQRVVGFGAAANMVHPATAWHVGLALQTSPLLALTLARHLSAPGASPADAAIAAWDVVWPLKRRLALPFHLLGGAILAETSMDEQREFLDAFFRTAKQAWGPFATWELDVLGMQRSLSPVFGAASLKVKKRMLVASMHHLLRPSKVEIPQAGSESAI